MGTGRKSFGEHAGELVADILGWLFCMAMVAGMYALGSWLAPHFGGEEHRDTFGVWR